MSELTGKGAESCPVSITELRKVAACIYIATDEIVAQDVSEKIQAVVTDYFTIKKENERLTKQLAIAVEALEDIKSMGNNLTGEDAVDMSMQVFTALAKIKDHDNG